MGARDRNRLHVKAERAFGASALRVTKRPQKVPPTNDAAKTAPSRGAPPARPQSAPPTLTPPIVTPPVTTTYPAPRGVKPPPMVVATPSVQFRAPPGVLPTSPVLPAFATPVLSMGDKERRLRVLDDTQVKGCPRCPLSQTRTHTVFGEGNVDAELMFIGEGPGENEDLTGRPFVGKAGNLLDKMIAGMGLKREQTYICNVVKCRPPDNRTPVEDEVKACSPYLLEQIEVVRPKVIVTLGLPATQFMLRSKIAMGKARGQWHDWRGIKLMPTYDPSYILRSYTPEVRGMVWSDLQMVMAELGLSRGDTGI